MSDRLSRAPKRRRPAEKSTSMESPAPKVMWQIDRPAAAVALCVAQREPWHGRRGIEIVCWRMLWLGPKNILITSERKTADATPENRELVRATKRAWKKANRDSVNASDRRSYQKNPVRAAFKVHRRRMLLAANGGAFTAAEIADIRRMQRDRCGICRCRLHGKGEIDHITPVARRGTNDRRNLQLLCKTCNARKAAKDQIDFMRGLGRLL
jgi:5-methylcytosine-specific restriction endonuclease McrA